MTAFLSEIKLRAAKSSQKSFGDVALSVLMFLPYILAAAFGLAVRGIEYAVAAATIGFEDGRRGKDPTRKKE